MSIIDTPLKQVLSSPLSSPLFSGHMWWLAFDQNASFAYDLSNNRYMRGGAGSSLALSLSETRASPAWVLQEGGRYKEVASAELAIGQGVGGQFSQEAVNLFEDPTDLTTDSWDIGPGCVATLTDLSNPAGQTQVTHVERIDGSYPFVRQGIVVVEDEIYTVSAVVKKINHRYVGLRCFPGGGATPYSVFDFDTESFTYVADGNSNPTATKLADEWYLISVSGEADTSTSLYASVALASVGGKTLPSTGEVPVGSQAYILWADAVEGGVVLPHTEGTRAADNPLVAQGAGSVPWPGYDIDAGATLRLVFEPSDIAGIEVFRFSDGTSDNYLTVRRGASDGVEVECHSGGVEVFSDESATDFPTSLATLELYMEQDATVTVSLDGTVLSDITQTGATLPDFTQLSLACVNGTTTIKQVYGK